MQIEEMRTSFILGHSINFKRNQFQYANKISLSKRVTVKLFKDKNLCRHQSYTMRHICSIMDTAYQKTWHTCPFQHSNKTINFKHQINPDRHRPQNLQRQAILKFYFPLQTKQKLPRILISDTTRERQNLIIEPNNPTNENRIHPLQLFHSHHISCSKMKYDLIDLPLCHPSYPSSSLKTITCIMKKQ